MLRPAAPDLGDGELEAVRLLDADSVLRAGDRVQDRCAAHLQDAVDARAGGARGDVDLELDLAVERLVQDIAGGGENAEHGGAGLAVLAPEDAPEAGPLLRGGTAVDHVHAFALALVNGTGPAEDACSLEPVEPGRAVEALLDVEHGQPATVAMRGERVELAGAAVGAIAVAELAAFDLPGGHNHLRLSGAGRTLYADPTRRRH